jgi:farnesyl-diphosphate farnesyltransferase
MELRHPDPLRDLLKAVSRSFYLTLRVLPAPVRRPIGLAYLLARTADTIADTRIIPLEQRLEALQRLRDRILAGPGKRTDFGGLARHQGTDAERALLNRVEEALTILAALDPADQQRIRDVLSVITGGQELDLQRFAKASAKLILALRTDAELDDYTYRVAGCVGEFWTRMCRAHLFPHAEVGEAFSLTNGVRFGKGLQLVNVLRDLPRDVQQGRCYLPADRLAAVGLAPADLLAPENEPKSRVLYQSYLALAESHLAAGWDYTNALPRGQLRVRLACAWPVLIGVKTIDKLRVGNVLDPRCPIKVTRAEVRRLVLRSLLLFPFPNAWRNLFTHAPTSVPV